MFGRGQAPFAHEVDNSIAAKLFGWYIICLGLFIYLFVWMYAYVCMWGAI